MIKPASNAEEGTCPGYVKWFVVIVNITDVCGSKFAKDPNIFNVLH